jgi:hypothetical protein
MLMSEVRGDADKRTANEKCDTKLTVLSVTAGNGREHRNTTDKLAAARDDCGKNESDHDAPPFERRTGEANHQKNRAESNFNLRCELRGQLQQLSHQDGVPHFASCARNVGRIAFDHFEPGAAIERERALVMWKHEQRELTNAATSRPRKELLE